jgi:hypothetical protein
VNYHHKNAGTRFVDLNGDGLVDVITSRPDNIVTFINQRKQATKLTSITNIDFSVAVFISGGVLSTDGVVSSNG